MVEPSEPEASTATHTDSEDDEPGVFESLLADITSWDNEADTNEATSEGAGQGQVSSTTRDQSPKIDDPPPLDDPLDRVRTILNTKELPSLPPLDELPAAHTQHTLVSRLAGLTLVGILLIVVVLLLVPGVLSAPPVDGATEPAAAVESGLGVAGEDAVYLNRVFRETSNEVAYCGGITTDSGVPVLELWMADTVSSSPGHIEFQTTNCPEGFQEVLVHTHPSGTTELSEQDVSVLRAGPARVMCVQAGPITTTPGATTQNLACYHSPSTGSDDLVRIPITITDTPATSQSH